MTLRHLKIFVAICHCGSATAAGEKLYIAQPSISLAISELESHYGIKLFDRIGKRLHITDSGKGFLQYATHIVDLFADMEQGVKNFDTFATIRIGSSITIGNYLLPNYILEFQKLHAHTKVEVVVANSDKIVQSILSNEVDIGLIEGIAHNPYIQQELFMQDDLVLICPKSHGFSGRQNVTLEELITQPLLLREMGSGGRELFHSTLTLQGLSYAPTWESVSNHALLSGVRNGLGVAILPHLLVKEAMDTIGVFSLKDISFSRNFSVIHHRNKFLTQCAKDFMAQCHKHP